MSLGRIIKFMTDKDARFLALARRGFYNCLPDEEYLKRKYKAILKEDLNLDNPQTYNEKLQWLKIHDRKPIYTTMVDKYEAKRFISNTVGEQYVIPTLGVWNQFDEIEFEKLPDQFVLKTTHDSGSVVIIKNKKLFIPDNKELDDAKKKLEKSLSKNYYYEGREWPYKNVVPRIIAEKYLTDYSSENALTDYKFFCFDGIPRIVYISHDKAKDPRTDFFDMEFNHLPIRMRDPQADVLPTRPECFEEMKVISRKLSQGIPHLRVDFYQINGTVYVGELTFYHNSGFSLVEPREWNLRLGSWIDISNCKYHYLKDNYR